MKNFLLENDEIWLLKSNEKKYSELLSLFDFFKKIIEKYPNLKQKSNKKPWEIAYNKSLFHFFLYYSYNPKYSFVICKKDIILFCSFRNRNKNTLEISFPIHSYKKRTLNHLNDLIYGEELSLKKKAYVRNVLIRDIDENFLNYLRKNIEKYNFEIKTIKEIKYATYDLKKTLKLEGNEFSNLRWHLNNFKEENYKIEKVSLKDYYKSVVHLIGQWRRRALKDRGFSFVDVGSDKLAARLFSNKNKCFFDDSLDVTPDDVLINILKIDGVVKSFHLGYPLGIYNKQDVFAHAIGICDLSVPHLSEYAQYTFWREVSDNGYRYINDGPSWRDSLEEFKNKFRPITKKRFYWVTLDI